MDREQLDNLINRLRKAYGNEQPFITKGFKLPWEECEGFADQIEEDISNGEFINDDFYETDRDVLEAVKEVFDQIDDSSWMFDDDE